MPLSVLLMTGLHGGPDEGHQQRLRARRQQSDGTLGGFLQSHSIAVSECCHRCLSLNLFTCLSASTVPARPSVPWPASLSLCQTVTPSLSVCQYGPCPSICALACLAVSLSDFNPITVCLLVQSLSVHLCLGLPRCLFVRL